MAKPNDHLPDLVEHHRSVNLVSYDDTWTKALDITHDTVAAYDSLAYDISGTTGAIVNIFIDSTGAPTDVRVLAQFSHDGGTTWNDYEEGLWASLYWEDGDTAGGVNKTFTLPCSGQDLLRFRTVATGTDGAKLFAVIVHFRAFRGGSAGAHA